MCAQPLPTYRLIDLTHGRRRAAYGLAAGTVALISALLAAACGGSSPPKVGTEESQPMLTIEVPTESSLLLPFRVAGWAIDRGSTSGPGVLRIEVYDGGCDGFLLGRAEYGIQRADIAKSFGDRFAESGWQFLIDRLSVGEHVLAVRLYSSLADDWACKSFSVSIL